MDAAALIQYLERVASSFEAETGIPDPAIRVKIAQLQAVLAQRDTAVRSDASRMQAEAAQAKGDEDVGAEVALRQASEHMAAVESALSQVEHELAGDADARHFLAQTVNLWLPVVSVPTEDADDDDDDDDDALEEVAEEEISAQVGMLDVTDARGDRAADLF
ncbi:hypothetical protein T492DRAFT_991619 [Pavlovales sp. CCMP2436]|nr:hypothetical protein T492DRAFT_991619 [Pavlovales sp. CCMP2436]